MDRINAFIKNFFSNPNLNPNLFYTKNKMIKHQQFKIQRSNPAPHIFKNQHVRKCRYPLSSSFVCSLSNNLFGFYNLIRKDDNRQSLQRQQDQKDEPDVIIGKIQIYTLRDEQWNEQVSKSIPSNSDIELLCFIDNQLLFYQQFTNSIECLNEEGKFGNFIQFQVDRGRVQMISSLNNIMILIQTESHSLLIDSTKQTIMFKYPLDGYISNQVQKLFFFDSAYLIENKFSKRGHLKFYYLQNKKEKKVIRLNFADSYLYLLNNCKYLAFIIRQKKKQSTATIMNIIDLKIIRKAIIKFEQSKFLNESKRYLMQQQRDNQNWLVQYSVDLQNFDVTVSKLDKVCKYKNQILMKIEEQNNIQQTISLWLPN